MKLVQVVRFDDTSNVMLFSVLKLVGFLSVIGFIGQATINLLTPAIFTPYHSEQFPMMFGLFVGVFAGMYLGMCIQKMRDEK